MNNIVSTFYTVTQRPTLTELSSNRQHRTRRADRNSLRHQTTSSNSVVKKITVSAASQHLWTAMVFPRSRRCSRDSNVTDNTVKHSASPFILFFSYRQENANKIVYGIILTSMKGEGTGLCASRI